MGTATSEVRMARSTLPLYPSDEGWPYPDDGAGFSEPVPEPATDDGIDLDRLELIADPHAWDDLSELERHALEQRFGFGCRPASMKELAAGLGCTRAEAREIVGVAIDKLRTRLS
jgi:hypothetical protein